MNASSEARPVETLRWRDRARADRSAAAAGARGLRRLRHGRGGRRGDPRHGGARRAGDRLRRGVRRRARGAALRLNGDFDASSRGCIADAGAQAGRRRSTCSGRSSAWRSATQAARAQRSGSCVAALLAEARSRSTPRTSPSTAPSAAHGARAAAATAHGPDPLQRRRAGHRPATARRSASIRAAARRGQAHRRVRRRDAAVPAGRAAHRLGAACRSGIPVTLITDNMAGHLMQHGQGRPASSSAPTASPPTATSPTRSAPTRSPCSRARHGIPFYVAAPLSTIDLDVPERRGDPDRGARRREVTGFGGSAGRRRASRSRNPAFDVTPANS